MSETSFDKKGRTILVASVAVNIFLVAFTLGRIGTPPMHPPMDHQGMFPPGMQQEGPRHQGFGGGHPPSFGPGDIFAPDEVKADQERMRENFDKMNVLRKDFAAQLQAGPVSKDAVLKHFADMDQLMSGVRKEAQDRAATKISTMSDEERKQFAQKLTAREGEPPRGGLHEGPREGQPEGQRVPMRDSINR